MSEPPPGTRSAFGDLHALRRVDDLGLAVYVAGEPAEARHVMRLQRDGGATFRTLLRGEAQPWAAGLAAAAGQPDLDPPPVPALLTLTLAGAYLGLTVRGVGHLVRRGDLYPLYGANALGVGQERYLFAAQVETVKLARALAVKGLRPARRRQLEERADTAGRVWRQIRQMLPPLVPEAGVEVDVRPLPSPDPLPLGRALWAKAAPLHIRGLQIAEQQGWLTYLHPVDGGYAVTLGQPRSRHRVTVTIPAGWLLPWLLGLADWHGRADLVAYRPGLGG